MKRQSVRHLTLLVSLVLFPITLYYFSPYLVIQGSFNGIASGSLVFFGIMFAASLVWGRAFCGWLCPAGSLQEKVAQVTPKSADGRIHNLIKYLIWAPWVAAIAAGFVSTGGIQKVDFGYMTAAGISASDWGGYVTYLLIVGLFLSLALALGKRGGCHTICWMAPFMVLGTIAKNRLGYPSLHLETSAEQCVSCGRCAKNCPMGLPVDEMVKAEEMRNTECILCGECVDGCAKNAIRYGYIWKTK